jgi:hypothetical protein
MKIRHTLIAAAIGGFVGLTPVVFAQGTPGGADAKATGQQAGDKAEQVRTEQMSECRNKARAQMVEGNRMRPFMQTCMEEAGKASAGK